MEKIWKAISKYFFYGFMLALLGWAGNMTVRAVRTALPADPIAPVLALALFDVGALAWLSAFLFAARGTQQRATALCMTALDVVGVVFMTAGGLTVASPSLVRVGMVVATAASYGALYFYHASSPEAQKAIAAQLLEDELQEEALRQATANIKQEARKLGAILSQRVSADIKYSLRLPMTKKELKEWQESAEAEGELIEPVALPDPDAKPSMGALFTGWLRSFFEQGARANSEYMSTSPTTSGPSQSDQEANE